MPKNNKIRKGLQFNNFFRYLILSEFNMFHHIWNQQNVANPMVFFLFFYDRFRIDFFDPFPSEFPPLTHGFGVNSRFFILLIIVNAPTVDQYFTGNPSDQREAVLVRFYFLEVNFIPCPVWCDLRFNERATRTAVEF